MIEIPCAFCGTKSVAMIHGRTGCVCTDCLGEAAKQVVAKRNVPISPSVTASDRCLLCGDSIASGALAVARGPYRLCHACIVLAVENAAIRGDESSFTQVNF